MDPTAPYVPTVLFDPTAPFDTTSIFNPTALLDPTVPRGNGVELAANGSHRKMNQWD
jgi:hypothetical protein